MGWWDDIQGFGTSIYNNAVTTAHDVTGLSMPTFVVDRWQDIRDAGTNIYHNASVANVVVGTASYSYKTVQSLFEQIAVIPKFAHSVIFHPSTRMVAGHVLRIAVEDLLPLVLVTFTNDMIQRHARNALDDEESHAFLSMDTALMTGLHLLNAASWAYSVRKKLQMTVRTTVLTIEAGRALNGVNDAPKMTLCQEEKCSKLRFIQGSIRDTATFFATEAFISLTGYIPFAGGYVAAVLAVHHHGRYIMSVVLPDLCNRHQVEYLKEYSERTLSLGLGHAALSSLAVAGIEYSPILAVWCKEAITQSILGHAASPLIAPGFEYFTIPSVWYEAAIQQFMMFTSISMAAHMSLPPAIGQSLRQLPDPVAAYQALIGDIFDTLALGLKVKIPAMLKLPPSKIPWGKITNFAIEVWRHPQARKVEYILIPRMLRSKQAFIRDPVIAPNWSGLRETSIVAIESIEKVRSYTLVKVGTLSPSISASTLWWIFGAPKSVIEILLKLLGNENFMTQVSKLRRKLEAMDGLGESPLTPNNDAFELRDERSLILNPPPEVKENAGKRMPNPEVIIQPVKQKANAEQIIHRLPEKKVRKQFSPEDIIAPKRNGFFENPENIIRPKPRESGDPLSEKATSETNNLVF